jgi:hypothetical protein
MDFDEISIPGLLFAVIAFAIGVIVSNSMGSGLVMRLLAGFVCAVAGYFIGGKISDG